MAPLMAGARNSARNSALQRQARAGVAMSVCTPVAMGMPPQLMSANLLGKHRPA